VTRAARDRVIAVKHAVHWGASTPGRAREYKVVTRRAKTTSKRGVTPTTVQRLMLALPGIEEGSSYGMPSFKLAGKFFARLRDDDTVLVVHLRSFDDRDHLITSKPEAFFVTDHYRNYPTILIRLAAVSSSALQEILADAWRRGAPRRMLEEHPELSGA